MNEYQKWKLKCWERHWAYIRDVIIPAAIKDAETNPNNPWYKTYENLPTIPDEYKPCSYEDWCKKHGRM